MIGINQLRLASAQPHRGSMKSRGLVLLMAIGVGVLLTAVLTGAAYYSYEGGAQNHEPGGG